MNGKVEELGEQAQKKAIKLKATGLSISAIMDELNKEYSSDLSELQVQRFFKRKQTAVFQIAREDKNFRNKMAQTYWNTVQQLIDLNAEMLELFYDIKNKPEYSFKEVKCPECENVFKTSITNYQTLLKAADVLLRQIKHVDDTMRKAQENNLNITVNLVDATQKIVKIMPQIFEIAERRGIIKRYNKKRLKQFQEDR